MLLFCDSFDDYSHADYVLKGWTQTGGGMGIDTTNGRGSTQAFSPGGGDNGLRKQFSSNKTTLIAGVAHRPNSGSNGPIISFLVGNNYQLEARRDLVSGRIGVYRNGTLLALGATAITNGVYIYVELKATIHNTAGSYELRINGVTELTASGVNTRGDGTNNYADSVGLCRGTGPNDGSMGLYDDFYVCDDVDSGVPGYPNDDFLGDVRVEARFPSAAGTTSTLDGSDGNQVNNNLLVDESPSNNGDTDYVESADIGDKDTYAFSDLSSGTGTVYGVKVNLWSRKTDAGSRSVCSVTRSGGVEEDSADIALTDTYKNQWDIREADPSGNGWTISTVNGIEAGMKVTS